MKYIVKGLKILIAFLVLAVTSIIIWISIDDYLSSDKTHLADYSSPDSEYYVSVSRIGDMNLVDYGETDEVTIIDKSEQVHALFHVHSKKYPTTANDYEVIWDEDGILIHGINETYGVYVENAALENRTVNRIDIQLIKLLLKDCVAVAFAVCFILTLFFREKRIKCGVLSAILLAVGVFVYFTFQGHSAMSAITVDGFQPDTYSYRVSIVDNFSMPIVRDTEYAGLTLLGYRVILM